MKRLEIFQTIQDIAHVEIKVKNVPVDIMAIYDDICSLYQTG